MSRLDPRLGQIASTGMRRVPFTLAFLAVMLAANAVAGTFSGHIDGTVLTARGIGVDAIRDGDVSRFVTAIFLSHDPAMLLRQLLFAASAIGITEWLWGSPRAAGLFFGIDLTATLVLLAAVALIPGLAALSKITDVGMSMGGFGLIGVLIAAHGKRAYELIAILGMVAGKYALAPERLADAGHVIALIIGFSIGLSVVRPATSDPLPDHHPEQSVRLDD
ncbi:hypothetical protein [Palleronia sp. LCG004]|uniref:hypothetical protein n=1 Tax=Palleronia sp. LCG004 TaxID=3079304 RepID=UPI002943DA55|nr:hypothetical protein [Palleronia sp. LCG004]WOI56686.1 hypothetical protein RVY76_02475 [Palleronia sp. LCG004]